MATPINHTHFYTDMSVAEYSELLSREPQKMREEMCELRQEFDSYKQKAQLVLKTKNNKVIIIIIIIIIIINVIM